MAEDTRRVGAELSGTVRSDPQRLEDASNIRDAVRQISQEASVAVDLLGARIEDKRLDGRAEAEDVRTISPASQ